MPEKRAREESPDERAARRDREEAVSGSQAPTTAEIQSANSQDFYASLDLTTNSIRLIRIRPELSSDGLIQCDMRLGNTEDTYTCLSYVWGEEPASHSIRIVNNLKTIRPNLYDFLKQARRLHHSKWLWIDTLCIDQSNIDERNHQVQQMGSIYKRAEGVISWLGNDEAVIRFLDLDADRDDRDTYEFTYLPYWKRAWITQEIALARHVVLMAGPRNVELMDAAEFEL